MRRIAVGLLLGLLATAIARLATSTSIGSGLEEQTYDWRLHATARQSHARPDIALIMIDESSVRALEPVFGRWPWPRVVHAGVIDFLARAHPRAIAYDVLFLGRDKQTSIDVGGRRMSGAESDAALAASVKRAGNVVVLADAVFEGMADDGAGQRAAASAEALKFPGTVYTPGTGFEVRPIGLPYSDLTDAAAAVGHNFEVKDSGAVARKQWPFIEAVDGHGVAVPSLGLAAALLAQRAVSSDVRLDDAVLTIGAVRMPLLKDSPPARPGEAPVQSRQALLNFHGPYRAADSDRPTYPVYSFFNVLLSEDRLESGAAPEIDPAVFKDKIVFVGTSADGMSDIWRSPFGGIGMPGVQLHAALADDALSGSFMRRASTSVDIAWTVALGVSVGLVAVFVPVAWAVPAVLVVALLFAGFVTRQIGHGVWIGAVAPLSAVAFSMFGGVAWQYFVEDREKRRVKGLFGRYVSKDVFDHLMADPSVARLGGERREMTVLFSDIRGFTTASERGTPEDVVRQLNEYFSAMVDVLFRHGGTLDKFVGDMVMGLFGAPVADAAHADHAVAAALDMITALDALNARWTAEGRPVLDIGIGINSGEMIAGNIGSETIMSYTVIGDAVNLGARLESLNKDYGTHILISEETRQRLTIDVETRKIGDVTVKGKTKAVTVYEVRSGKPEVGSQT